MRSRDMVEFVDGLRPDDVIVTPADPATRLESGQRIVLQ
jgi:hypothetical protein